MKLTRAWMLGAWAAATVAGAQTNGVWNTDSAGYWDDPTKWAGGLVGSGTSATGNFWTLNIAGGRTVTLTNAITIGHMLFADTGGGGTHDWTVLGTGAGSLNLAVASGAPTILVTNRSVYLNAILTGTQGFTKTGNGSLYMSSHTNNTLTGPVRIEGGYHLVQGEGVWGLVPGTFSANALTFGNVTVHNNNIFLTVSTNRGVTLVGNTYFRVGSSKQTTMHSAITGAGGLGVAYDGSYLLVMNQANDYAGDTIVGSNPSAWDNNGSFAALRLGNDEVIPHGIGKGNLIVTNGATTVANKWNAYFQMNGFSETINGLTGNGVISNNAAPAVALTLGAGDGSGVFTGIIDDAANGAISVVKTGRGVQTLDITNRYDGLTSVQDGILALGGVNAFGGGLAVNPYAALSVGRTNAAGTLTVSGATAVSNATMIVNLSDATTVGGGVNDLLAVGAVDLGGANHLVVRPLRPLVTGSPYTVVTYTGVSGAGTLDATAPGTRYALAVDTTVPGQVRLSASGAPSNLVWAGNSRRWNLTNSVAWTSGGSPERFYDMDSVTFDDTQAGGFVGIESAVRPGSVAVGGTRSYTWVGNGGLDGTVDLVKSGSGVLMLYNTNMHSGVTRVEGGTLVTMNTLATGPETTPVVVTNGGTWDIRGVTNQYRAVTVSGAGVDGQGAVVNNGAANMSAFRFFTIANDVTLGGINRWDVRNTAGAGYVSTLNQPFSVTKVGPGQVSFVHVVVDPNLGDIRVNEGGFALEGTSTAGDASYSLIVQSNAFFQMWGTVPLNKQFNFLGGSRLYTGSGSEANNHLTGSIQFNGGIVLADFTGANQWNMSAPVSGDGGIMTISSGTLRFNESVAIGGPIVAQAGTIAIQSNSVVSAASAIVLRGGTFLIDDGRVTHTDRVGDSIPVALSGGTLIFRGQTGATVTETLGTANVLGGVTTLRVENGNTPAASLLTLGAVNRQQGTLNFTFSGLGTLGGVDSNANPLVFFTGVADGVMPYATVNGTNFAWYTADYGVTSMVPPSAEFNGAGDQSGTHVKFTAGNGAFTLDAARAVSTMTITPGAGQGINVAGNALTVSSGGVLLNGNSIFTISDTIGGGGVSGSGLLFHTVNAASTVRVDAVLGGSSFSKEGPGWMILTSQAATTDGTRIGNGILQLGAGGTTGNVGDGDVVNYGTLRFDRSDSLNFTNAIGGGGGLWKTNQNTLTMSGANTYTGSTLIGSGVVVVEKISDGADSNLGVVRPERPVDSFLQLMDSELQVTGGGTSRTIRTVYVNRGGGMTVDVSNASGVLQFDGQVVGGSAWLTKEGSGTLVLGGEPDNTSLQLRVEEGTVELAKERFAISRGVSNLIVTNDALVRLTGNGGNQIAGNVTMGGSGTLDLNGRNDTINSLYGASGTVLNNAAGTTSQFTVGRANGTGNFGGTIDDGTGVVALHKTGTGTFALTNAANTYSGGTVLSNGTLYAIADGALGALPATPQADNIVAYGGKLQNYLVATAIAANRGIQVLGTNLYLQAGWSSDLTVNGNISGPGSVTIAADSGFVVLAGSNSFGGNLVLPAQTSRLRLLNADAVPYGDGKGGVVTRTVFDVNGLNVRANWLEGSQYARIVNSNAAAATLTIGEGDGDTRYWSGVINNGAGTLGLTKVGNGIAVLQAVGTNTMSGGVQVNGGVLALDSAPNSTVTVAAGAEGRLVNRFGAVTVDAGGSLALGATYEPNTVTLNGGTLSLTGAGLYEGRLAGSFDKTTANPATAVRLGTSYAHTREDAGNGALFPNNSTYVYTGYLFVPGDADVTWTFAKAFDDSELLKIDGTTWIDHPAPWNALAMTNVTLSPGYHSFELRAGQGTGGVGPAFGNWVWGFMVDPEGRGVGNADYFVPMVDAGDGSTFVVSTNTYGIANALNIAGNSRIDLAGVAKPVVSGAVAIAANVEFTGVPGRSAEFLGAVTLGATPQVTVTSGVSVAMAGAISGGFGLTKAGGGTLSLSGTNVYSGTTLVSGGILELAGEGSVASSTLQIDAGAKLTATNRTGGSMTLASGQTLRGNGTFVGGLILDANSTLAPGASPGTLTVVGDLTMESGSFLTVELNGLAAGTGYDQIVMDGGALTLNSATLNLVLGFSPDLGNTFAIITGLGALPGGDGIFTGRPNASTFTVNSTEFRIDYSDEDVTLTVVPEPASLGMLGLLAVAAMLRRRAGR
jgi:autotransporter-associated beta strand protein